MTKTKLPVEWVKVGDSLIRNSEIESTDVYMRWLRTTSGKVHLIPKNQKNKVARILGLLK